VVVFGTYVRTYWRVNAPYVLVGGYLLKSADAPSVVLGRGGILYSPLGRWPWLEHLDIWLNQNFELGAHLLALTQSAYEGIRHAGPAVTAAEDTATVTPEEAERRLTPVLEEIEQTRRIVRRAGIELVVLLINPQEPTGGFLQSEFAYDDVVERFCQAQAIPVVNPLPALVSAARGQPIFRAVDDGHWTRAAHRLAAESLYAYLRRERLLGHPSAAGQPGSVGGSSVGTSQGRARHLAPARHVPSQTVSAPDSRRRKPRREHPRRDDPSGLGRPESGAAGRRP
jgi:hypothetical protein